MFEVCKNFRSFRSWTGHVYAVCAVNKQRAAAHAAWLLVQRIHGYRWIAQQTIVILLSIIFHKYRVSSSCDPPDLFTGIVVSSSTLKFVLLFFCLNMFTVGSWQHQFGLFFVILTSPLSCTLGRLCYFLLLFRRPRAKNCQVFFFNTNPDRQRGFP